MLASVAPSIFGEVLIHRCRTIIFVHELIELRVGRARRVHLEITNTVIILGGARDRNEAAITRHANVRRQTLARTSMGEEEVLSQIVAFQAVKEWEENRIIDILEAVSMLDFDEMCRCQRINGGMWRGTVV